MFPISDSIQARRFPFFNLVLIAFTAFVFVQQITVSDPDAFIMQYALVPAYVDFSNLATLFPFISAIFLHGGLLHIVSNMWFLWVFGDNVEGHLGWFLYLILYFGAGIVGNFLQYMVMPHSSIPMLGASGAVAGVLGAYYVLFPHSSIKTFVPLFGFFTLMHVGAPFMLGYWFILQLLSGAASLPGAGDTGGVAFWAHVGGFVAGFVFANLFREKGDESYS